MTDRAKIKQYLEEIDGLTFYTGTCGNDPDNQCDCCQWSTDGGKVDAASEIKAKVAAILELLNKSKDN